MNVNILYLYPDFMSLYGDNGNVRILTKRLIDQGFEVSVTRRTITDKDIGFEDVDFVYMGSGYESNRNLAAKHLAQFKDALIKAIDDGVPMLFTGNSYDILGKGITSPDGSLTEGLGIFNFTFKEQLEKRYTGDVILADKQTGDRYVGFVNRAGVPDADEDLVFDAIKVIGNIPVKKDSVRRNNLLGISLIGPVLLKNPKLADNFVETICRRKGQEYKAVEYPHSIKSHAKTLKALLETDG
jgi:CobQ-like glutamine amidotransferase family enzyme